MKSSPHDYSALAYQSLITSTTLFFEMLQKELTILMKKYILNWCVLWSLKNSKQLYCKLKLI